MRRRMEDDARARVRHTRFERQAGFAGVACPWVAHHRRRCGEGGIDVQPACRYRRHRARRTRTAARSARARIWPRTWCSRAAARCSSFPMSARTRTRAARVMTAWDLASREAARAVADALPVLQAGGERGDDSGSANSRLGPERPDRHGDLPGADIARHLARHGVNVEVPPDRDPRRVHRRHAAEPDRGRVHRPARDGRVRPRPGARDLARRSDPRPAPAHDGSGAGVALTIGRGTSR